MEKRKYIHIQVLLLETKAMLAEWKTQREVAEYYGFQDNQVVKRLLARERRKARKLEAGILPRPKGQPNIFIPLRKQIPSSGSNPDIPDSFSTPLLPLHQHPDG